MPSAQRQQPLRHPCLPRLLTPPGAAGPSSFTQQQQRQLPPPPTHALRGGGASYRQKPRTKHAQPSADRPRTARPHPHLSARRPPTPFTGQSVGLRLLLSDDPQPRRGRGRPNPGPAQEAQGAHTRYGGCQSPRAASQPQHVEGASTRRTAAERRDMSGRHRRIRVKVKLTADTALVAHPG